MVFSWTSPDTHCSVGRSASDFELGLDFSRLSFDDLSCLFIQMQRTQRHWSGDTSLRAVFTALCAALEDAAATTAAQPIHTPNCLSNFGKVVCFFATLDQAHLRGPIRWTMSHRNLALVLKSLLPFIDPAYTTKLAVALHGPAAYGGVVDQIERLSHGVAHAMADVEPGQHLHARQ
jgi:hypothetical protein